MSRSRFLVTIAASGAAMLALAGCGSSGTKTTPTTVEPITPTTPMTTTTATTATTTGSSASGAATLTASVGPGFDISLKDASGKAVSKLAAGSYTINVDDQSDVHDFHLTGPGVDKSTDVAGTGSDTWKVTLKPGTYHYQCDPHAAQMNGDFTVS